MSSNELELCARFLGEPYRVELGRIERGYQYIGGGYTSTRYARIPEADLLLALLMRAAELGLFTQLEFDSLPGADADERWIADVKAAHGYGPTPLAAMIQAVEKYQEGI